MSVLEKVKELREITGAGMQDCKNALKENGNDIEKSIDYLRKKGVLKAAKKSSRDAAEGLVIIGKNDNCLTLTEINSETDFVAKNKEFLDFCNNLSKISTSANNLEELNDLELSGNKVSDNIVNLVAKIGENIKLRRFSSISKEDGSLAFYIHNKSNDVSGKIAAVLKYKSKNNKSVTLATNICMHIAAMSPLALDKNDLDQSFIENEKKIIDEQIDKKGKKPEILDKIVSGKLNKVISENTLLGQNFVIDQDFTVEKAIDQYNSQNSDNFEIINFIKFKVGEGIKIEKADFSEEVKSLVK